MALFIAGIIQNGTTGTDSLGGGDGDDQLFGLEGDDELNGGKGNDVLDGGDGDDVLVDEEGNNTLLGGAGDDSLLNFGPGASTLDGGSGHDDLVFGHGSTKASGGDGNDRLFARDFGATAVRTHVVDGGTGNDYIEAALSPLANLTLAGGSGSDVFNLLWDGTASPGAVTISDFKAGDGGDRLSIYGALSLLDQFAPSATNPFAAGFVRFVQSGADTLIQVKHAETAGTPPVPKVSDGFTTLATLTGVTASALVAANIEGNFDPKGGTNLSLKLDGTLDPDRLVGGFGDDVIFAGEGRDEVFGNRGADEIHGGAGSDALHGDDGSDILHGDEGIDQLWGGAGNDRAMGGDGNDTLRGDEGNDTLHGNDDNDALLGGEGNDVLLGGAGSDFLDGGAGMDQAQYDGPASAFTVKYADGIFKVSDTGGALAIDHLVLVERLRFTGESRSYAIDIDGNAGQAYRLYQAAFNRTPDAAGLKYWIDALDSGAVKLPDVAALFITSAEFKAAYGAEPTNAFFLDKLYDNILHRKPDSGGYNFWLDVLDKKLSTTSAILASFSESPENVAGLVGVIGDGFWIG